MLYVLKLFYGGSEGTCMVAHCSHKKTDLKYHIKVEIYENNGKNSNDFRKKRNLKKTLKKTKL